MNHAQLKRILNILRNPNNVKELGKDNKKKVDFTLCLLIKTGFKISLWIAWLKKSGNNIFHHTLVFQNKGYLSN